MITLGLGVMVFGLIMVYLMASSVVKLTLDYQKWSDQLKSDLLKANKNELFTNSLPGLVIVAIGVLLMRVGVKK